MNGSRFVATRSASIGSSGIRRIFDLAATMTDPIDLSMGQPDFQPPESVRRAAIQAIDTGHNNYTVTQGLPERDPAGPFAKAGGRIIRGNRRLAGAARRRRAQEGGEAPG